MREAPGDKPHLLAGSRAIEWSWVVAHLPKTPGRVLDLGCVESVLTGIASRLGHQVTAVDLREIEYDMVGVSFLRKNILDLDFTRGFFDVIINCSMIEHVGLKDRYGSDEISDGDLIAMRLLSQWLKPQGTMILTIPVGLDAVVTPFHRIYGAKRLPELLHDYVVIKEEYWAKDQTHLWKPCNKDVALSTSGSAVYYALGLFVLEK
jgi:2-polyprenyl-3-methyl-5-hydroxy-6-metoxy-1,4-benzoquinol methylase